MNDPKRLERREIRLMNGESVWLQKALFALRKAEDSWDKQAELRADEPGPYTLALGGRTIAMEELEDAIEEKAQSLLKSVRERRRKLR